MLRTKDEVRDLSGWASSWARSALDRAVNIARILSYDPTQRDLSYRLYVYELLSESLSIIENHIAKVYLLNKEWQQPRVLTQMKALSRTLNRIIAQLERQDGDTPTP